MELDLIIPDVEPNNNNMNEDAKSPTIMSLVSTKIVGGSTSSSSSIISTSSNDGNVLGGPGLRPCSMVNVTSRGGGLVPSVMIRPVMTLAPSPATLMLPHFVPIRPRQPGLQMPVQVPPSIQVQPIPSSCSKTLTILPKTQVVQPTSSGLRMPLLSVQVGAQRTPQPHYGRPQFGGGSVPQSASPLPAPPPPPSAVTVVKLPPGTDIEALTNMGNAGAGCGDSRGRANQFWQYVCGDCPYTTSDYKLYKRHRVVAHDTSKTQTKVCHICNKGFLDLDNHLKVHENGRKYVCDVCDLGFHSSVELENHIAKKHHGRQFLKCGYCDASIAKEDISQHLNTCELFRRQQQATK